MDIRDFAAGVTENASPGMQKMLDAVGYFRLPPGQITVRDTVLLPSNLSGRGTISGYTKMNGTSGGAGKQVSALVAKGMHGAALFRPADPAGQHAYVMREFAVTGDCDHVFDFGGAVLADGIFTNLMLESRRQSFIALNQHYCRFDSVRFSSELDHAVEVNGGNTTLFNHCYAAKVGPSHAGYRIHRNAMLNCCNGLGTLTGENFWLWQGNDSGGLSMVQIGGLSNLEDWGRAAIYQQGNAIVALDMVTIQTRQDHAYTAVIEGGAGNTKQARIGEVGLINKGGSSRRANAEIHYPDGGRVLVTRVAADPAAEPFGRFATNINGGTMFEAAMLTTAVTGNGETGIWAPRFKTES